jgi:fucokinase
MNSAIDPGKTEFLTAVADNARQHYAACVAGLPAAPVWWTAVVLTASSTRQADRYRSELNRRRAAGKLPANVHYLVVPDIAGRRIGSGGATLNALRELCTILLPDNGNAIPDAGLEQWWKRQRVLLLHCGGDSRRLPQYSLSGKLFSALPAETPWGEPSTVFDETMALSTGWVEHLPSGLVAGSGDVILTFDAATLAWDQPGVNGVGMLQPVEASTRHGVYVTDEQGRIYSFLQKPSVAEVQAAGGLLAGDCVALDTGLLRFDAESSARLTRLAGARECEGRIVWTEGVLQEAMKRPEGVPEIDLYQHFTMALTGQWKPGPDDPPVLAAVADTLRGVPFFCSVVRGDFTHIGTTSLFRRLMTEETEFSAVHAAQRRLGASRHSGVRSAGVVMDSVLSGGADLKPGTLVIECFLTGAIRAATGAVLHGLEGISGTCEVPEDVVVHQLPVLLPDGRMGSTIRVYGVDDDPKATGTAATWFGRSLYDELYGLGIDPEAVWPGLAFSERSLWNAQLFPLGTAEEAWICAQWMLRMGNGYSVEKWRGAERMSLATSAQWADTAAVEASRARRLKEQWRVSALSLVESGSDIRPLLANAPGIGLLAETGEALSRKAVGLEGADPSEAASRYYVASLFFGQAGLIAEADGAHESAFRMVEHAVECGTGEHRIGKPSLWHHGGVRVEGPARIDLGGGWSDAPPFCLDWGGTVLNLALLLEGNCPIQANIHRLCEPLIRCAAGPGLPVVEYRSCEEILQAVSPGDEMSIPRTALRMTGLFDSGQRLETVLESMGGGLEIRTEVDLPLGSGLGTSSILAACMLRALAEMTGDALDNQVLSERVMRLEQLMTTGGGWQDQAGGIYPGAKLLHTGPGLRQRIRVQPVAWTSGRQADFESRVVLHYTGIRRVARDLLRQVVGRYLARETACLQVLHSIKTLALEMAHALVEGDWEHLGGLLDRHWALNQILDPHTTNAPINALLDSVRPYIYGAKLAGAGGGGFMILIARSPEAAAELRESLRKRERETGGRVYRSAIAAHGLRVERWG